MGSKVKLLAWTMIGKMVYLLPKIWVKAQFGEEKGKR